MGLGRMGSHRYRKGGFHTTRLHLGEVNDETAVASGMAAGEIVGCNAELEVRGRTPNGLPELLEIFEGK